MSLCKKYEEKMRIVEIIVGRSHYFYKELESLQKPLILDLPSGSYMAQSEKFSRKGAEKWA